jgi:uncharacterized integral membrane protein (TIGR00698 family)
MGDTKYRSKLIVGEDYWAIWLGGFFLVAGIIIYLFIGRGEMSEQIAEARKALDDHPIKSISWHMAGEQSAKLNGSNTFLGKEIKSIFSKPKTWKGNPIQAFYSPDGKATQEQLSQISELEIEVEQLQVDARQMETQARINSYQDKSLNDLAISSADRWREKHNSLSNLRAKAAGSGFNILPDLLKLTLLLAVIFGVGAYFMGSKYFHFILAFVGVFVLSTVAYLLASQSEMKDMGINYAVWAILLGLIISNTVSTPAWLKPAVQTEYYIKTGLVLLGAEILLSKIVAIGLPGIFVAWVVTPIVLVTTYWFGQKILKIGSKTLNMTISADMSVCGVSAAIATAAACNAKKEELTLAVGLSMVFTSIMMIAMPAFINAVGIPEVLGGAWIGGTIDATGAVVAAGAFLGDKALNVAATIKMIQNVLIGLIAFGVAVYWATKVENDGKAKVGISEIWKRFPKFILGFLGASVVFSIIYAFSPEWVSSAFIDHGLIGGYTKNLRGWLFCLAFTSIGLSVNFKELKHQFSGGKPLILYLCGQSLNLILTLLMAYVMFYLVFPEITEMI